MISFSLYGINLSASLIESAVDLVQSPNQRRRRVAALLIHLAILLTMVAHLFDGFYGQTQQGISDDGVIIPGIGLVIAQSVENIYHPDGSLKNTKVALTIRRNNGERIEQSIAYNEPALFDHGEWEIIIQSGNKEVSGFILGNRGSGEEITLTPKSAVRIIGGKREAKIIALSPTAGRHSKLMLNQTVHFKELTYRPVASVMVRYNPAILLITFALIISAISIVLLKPTWWRREQS